MADNFWKQFGDTYDKVNENTGGIADYVKSVGQKLGEQARNPLSDPQTAPVLAGMQGFTNAMTGGILGAAQQKIAPNENLQGELESKYPVASGIGGGAGLAGQLAAIPVAPAAEAGTAAAKILPTIGRNVLTAGAVSAPSAVAQGIQTGDWGGALKQGLINTGIGAALGTGAEKVASAIPAVVNALKKTLTAQAIRGGLDIDTRALRKITTYGPIGKFAGAVLDRVDDLKQQLVNLMVDHPQIKTELGRRNLVKQMDDQWGKVDNAFNAYQPPEGIGKVRSFQNEILQHPLVQDAVNSNPELLGTLDDIINKADTGKNLASTRHILQKDYIDPSYAVGSKTDDEQVADLARGIHDVIDNHFVPDELKATYARDKVIKEALMREDLKLPVATQAGSPTFARLAASAAMGGMGGGAGLLAGQDPGEALRTAALTSAAGLIGGVGGRVGSRLINKGMAGGEARLAQLLGRLPESELQGVEQIAPRIAQLEPKFASMNQQAALQNVATDQNQQPNVPQPAQAPVPTQITPAELTQTGAPAPAPTDASALLNPPTPEPPKVAPEHAEGVQQATLKEQELEPQQVAAAKDAARQPFEDSIKKKILNDWNTWQNPYKADFDTFFEQAKASTNNFDPKNINTAKIIAGPNYKDYLKSYNVALNLQSLGKDLTDAIGYWGMPALLGGAEAKEKHNQLVNTLYMAMTGEMKEPDKASRGQIENRLAALRKEHLTANSQKSKLMELLQNEYGVRFDMLRQYGAI